MSGCCKRSEVLSCGCFWLYSCLIILAGGCVAVLVLFHSQAYISFTANIVKKTCVISSEKGLTRREICLSSGWQVEGSPTCLSFEVKCLDSQDASAGRAESFNVTRSLLVEHFMDIRNTECLPCNEQHAHMSAEVYKRLRTHKNGIYQTFPAYMDTNNPGYVAFNLSDPSDYTQWYIEKVPSLVVLILPSVVLLLVLVVPIVLCCHFRCRDYQREKRWRKTGKNAISDVEYKTTGFEYDSMTAGSLMIKGQRGSLLYRGGAGGDEDGYRAGLLSSVSGSASTPPRAGSGSVNGGTASEASKEESIPMTEYVKEGDSDRRPEVTAVSVGPAPLARMQSVGPTAAIGSDSVDGVSVSESVNPVNLSQYDRFLLLRGGNAMSLPRGTSTTSGGSSATPNAYKQMYYPSRRTSNSSAFSHSPSFNTQMSTGSVRTPSSANGHKPGRRFVISVADSTVPENEQTP